MDFIMDVLCYPLGYLMKFCWDMLSNYGLAIILFTLLTKIVLAPLSVWLHMNSIKMVKIQPDINFMKVKYYGDSDKITEEENKFYKKVKYNPFISIIPLVIQIILLMCVVYIIKEPLTHILHLDENTCRVFADLLQVDWREDQLAIVEAVRNGKITLSALTDEGARAAFASIEGLDLSFLGMQMNVVASKVWGLYTLVPVVAGISAFALCWVQNVTNVLQQEQGKINKYGLTVVSVGISLILGFFVYSGVALYWIASNLFAIAQQLILNACINPKKRVDYQALEKSRQALADIEGLDKSRQKDPREKELKAREKADYKKFFKVVNKHLVIYSERSGFYKYYEALIRQLLAKSNILIHYITNDPDDNIFELAKTEPRIRPYYVGIRKLVTLMMKMDADIVIMTTPDLEKYYIKRSLVRKDIEYVYIPHEFMSMHFGFQENAFDKFDTIFCAGPHLEREHRETEAVYGLHEKTLVKFGYPLEEKLAAAFENEKKMPNARPEILIAPSWQEDNLLDSCIDQLLSQLVCDKYHVTVRPHPEYVKRYPEKLQAVVDRFAGITGKNLTFELDFSSNKSVYSSDLLITDWSGIAYEYCFATKRPVMFINTKVKCGNPNWKKIASVPVDISLRDKVGISLEKDQLDKTAQTAETLLSGAEEYRQKLTDILPECLYSFGDDGKTGAMYILTQLSKKQQSKKD